MSPARFLLFALALLLLSSGVRAQVGKNTSLVNPNLATKDELTALSGIDEKLAGKIIDARPFLTMSKLHALLSASLSGEELSGLYRKMFLPLDLNAATKEEIGLIPGVGKRMTHEFEEYRPYTALPRFRREIGKYVDEKEVARLEQYVFVPMDLNQATAEDFHTIPGVGKRMVHEFLEYRPYKSIAQFRREIGKYVDEKEVARLERYVYVGSESP